LLLRVHRFLDVSLTTPEAALLAEEGYGLDRQGEVQVRSQYLSTNDNVRFTFRMLYRVFRKLPRVRYGVSGWDAFRQAVAIRNRITHPKRLTDYRVSTADLRRVEEGLAWYRESLAGQSYGILSGVKGASWRKIFGAQVRARRALRPTTG
jgi:hypothetical protein